MNKETILSHLTDHPWSRNLQVFEEVESTNTLLKALGREVHPTELS